MTFSPLFPGIHVFGCKASQIFMEIIQKIELLEKYKKYTMMYGAVLEHSYMKELNRKEAEQLFVVRL